MLPQPLLYTLQQQGWVVVPNIALDPDNASLLALGRALGEVSGQGNHSGAPNLEAEGVNRVHAMAQPLRDAAGNEVFSSNAAVFPLHTDDSFSPQPARYVLMHCWQPDPAGGGQSHLAHLGAIAAAAPTSL
jgi:alpha-ketoglutarate-dependent taurine dioxygenase